MPLIFDFWENYQDMLKVIIWKEKFIPPNWENRGVPLKLVNTEEAWALLSKIEDKIHIHNIEVVYSQRSIPLQEKAMKKLVHTYFELYREHLTGAEPQ